MAHRHIGRRANRPSQLPIAGWKDIIHRVRHEIERDNLSLVAAGVAFYGFLAVFPAIGALVSLYGLAYDPTDIQRQMAGLAGILPREAVALLEEQLSQLVAAERGLGLGFVIGLVLTVWSASRAMKALISALNIVYGETERRSFIRFNLVGLFFTFCMLVFAAVSLVLIVGLPGVLQAMGLPGLHPVWSSLARWALLVILAAIGLAMVYRYAPYREEARFRWVTWGSVVATAMWLLTSIIFSLYVSYFGNYNATYGSLGAIVVLMLWFYLGALAVLLGGELNSEMEHQSRKDSTTDPVRPMGQRGAYVADTLGRSHVREDESS